jgi:Ca2+-binding RTX toxin-like protein
LQSTSTAGTQGFWSNLLAGATNSNPNAHLDVANLRFSVNNSTSTVITPVGIQYANKSIMVDPNNTAFRALAAGQSDTIVASYNIVDGLGSSVAQTDTIIINGQGSQGASSVGVNTPTPNNHAPEVSAPVTAQASVHTSAFWSNMLAGATDSDVGNQLYVSNVLFSLNGGVAVSSAPKGIQVANDQLLVDPNSTAFNHLGVGQADTIVASYNVIDGHGGSVAQTDTVTISGPAATVANGIITGTTNHDILTGTAGKDIIIVGPGADTLTGGKGADVFKYTSLSNSPTSSTAPTTTITDFSATDGDRVDVTAILNGTSTLNSTIHINQTGTSNTSLSVTVGGVEYYIANVPNQAVSVPDAVANPASGVALTTALHGADWTTVVDVASAHGAPSTITAAGSATVANAAVNPAGDWTAIVQAGSATVNTAQSQVTFAAAPTANAVSIQTADTTVHEVSHVTAVVWHA